MGRVLSEADVARYHEQGFLCPVDALTPEEVAFYRGKLEGFEAAQGKKLNKMPGAVRGKTHQLFTWMDALVRHPRVLDAVEDLVGPDILLFHLTCWIKEPGDRSFTSWHQDGTYFGLEPYEHVTAWVALSDSDGRSGCVTVVPGSHTAGPLPHFDAFDEGNLLSRGQTLRGMTDRPTVDMPVKAGQFSLHHTHLIHRSGPNEGSDRRIGIGISYIPTRVRHTGPKRMPALLVRGEDRYGHYDLETPPAADFDEAARARHADGMARYFEFSKWLSEQEQNAA